MKNVIKVLLLSLILIPLFTSCENPMEEADQALGRSVSINLSGIARAGSRTLIPDNVETPDNYTVSLVPMKSENGSFVEDTALNKQEFSSLILGSNQALTLTGVKIGTYKVTVQGFKNNLLIMEGTTDNEHLLTVSASGENKTTIQLKLISDGNYTGNIEVVFDFSEVAVSNAIVKEAVEKGTLNVQLYLKESLSSDSDTFTLKDEKSVPANTTTFTFTSKALPVTKDGMVYFKISAGEQLLIDNYAIAAAQIYSGHTSKPDNNENKVFTIKEGDIAKAKNVSEVDWHFDENRIPVITWKNITDRSGNNLLDHVVLTFTKHTEAGDVVLDPITVNVKDGTSSYTFSTIEKNTQYSLAIQAFHTSGYASAKKDINFKNPIEANVKVTTLTINDSNLPTSIKVGDTFTLSVNVGPEDAQNKAYTWSYSTEGILSASAVGSDENTTFTANTPGSTTITATSTDSPEIKDTTGELKVSLATPQNVTSSFDESSGINISWNAVTSASSYDLYRSVDNGEFVKLTNVTSTTYQDTDLYASRSYSYKVMAVFSDTAYNSELSTATAALTIKGTVITVTQPTIEGTTINFNNVEKYNYVSAGKPFSITVGEIAGATNYT